MLTGDVDLFPTSGCLISGEVRGDDNAAGKENTPSTTSLDFLEVWPSGNLGAMKQELREVKFQEWQSEGALSCNADLNIPYQSLPAVTM